MKYKIEKESIRGVLEFGEISISPNEKVGFRPYELFVSSIIGCSGTLLRNVLTKKRIPYQKIEMEVSSVRNLDKQNRIEKLSITAYVLSDQPLSAQQAEKVAALVIKNCGMIQSVIQSIEIALTVKSLPANSDSK